MVMVSITLEMIAEGISTLVVDDRSSHCRARLIFANAKSPSGL